MNRIVVFVLVASLARGAVQTPSLTAIQTHKFGGHGGPLATDDFGYGLRLHGDGLVVMHSFLSSSLSLQEFRRESNGWQFQANLPLAAKPWNFAYGGNLALIGFPDFNGGPGRVAVLRKNASAWNWSWLNAPEGAFGQAFGVAVALHGSTVVVGCPLSSAHLPAEGALYIYEDTGSALALRASFYGGVPGKALGQHVAVDGDEVLAAHSGGGGWALRAYSRNSAGWSMTQASLGVLPGLNSGKLAMHRNLAVFTRSSGGAVVYANGGAGWFQDGVIADVPGSGGIGAELAIHDGVIALCAPQDGVGVSNGGSVRLFARNAGWKLQQVLWPADIASGDGFGRGIALDQQRLVAGAPGQDQFEFDGGAVYEFQLSHAPARVHCVPELSTRGCLGRMGFSGTPSATSPQPFMISASAAPSIRGGALLFTVAGPAFVPFPGGVRCLASPALALPAQLSSGSPAIACDGAFSLDFNAVIQSGSWPQLAPGATVNVQWVFRDPDATNGSAVSEALEFTIQ